ncbi:MAG: M20 aminoacylase family protein [Hyphomicrobium sp.]
MPVIAQIAAFHDEMTSWRRHVHAHPETAFEEHATAAFVAERLSAFGLHVHRGLARTGVVGTLNVGEGRAVGLRADMDALPIAEANPFDHRSRHPGRMHACGHDGHTAMLLGAARYLAETRRFSGTVHFIFQPAEEAEGGGRVMVEEGLFSLFPVAAVYGMHNWPGLPVGRFAVRPGPMMAAFDIFEIILKGTGTHGAMPHLGADPIVAGAALVQALQTVVSRTVDPLDAAVVSVTRFHAGEAWNVIPETAVLAGTARALRSEVRDTIEATVRRIAGSLAAAHGVAADIRYEQRYPATVNDPAEAVRAAKAAALVVAADYVDLDPLPSMGSEDFAFMLLHRPGCYIWIGNGSGDGNRNLHSPHYDFNDAILPLGASYWARLVETVLSPGGGGQAASS